MKHTCGGMTPTGQVIGEPLERFDHRARSSGCTVGMTRPTLAMLSQVKGAVLIGIRGFGPGR